MDAKIRKLEQLKRQMRQSSSSLKKPSKFTWKIYLLILLLGLGFTLAVLQQFSVIDLKENQYLSSFWDTVQTAPVKYEKKEVEVTPIPEVVPLLDPETFYLPAHRNNDPMLVKHQYYTLHYNEDHEQANWVAYRLEANQLRGDAKRPNDFRTDPRVPTGSATPNDYRKSGYDRGHFAPSADFKFSVDAMSETFFMSNMSPQINAFNAGIWHELEKDVRAWATQKKTIYVVMGPILESGLKKIGSNKVSVPNRYFKIVFENIDNPKVLAFLMPNRESYLSPENYTVTIDEIEEITGLDFFPDLENHTENVLESQVVHAPWFR